MKKALLLTALNLTFCTPAAAQYNIDNSANKLWAEWVQKATEWKWDFSRTCYPNDGMNHPPYCTMAFTSPPRDGKQLSLREFYDSNSILMGRSMCEFQVNIFVRTCWNIDNGGGTVREMMDTSTNTWKVIPNQPMPQQQRERVY